MRMLWGAGERGRDPVRTGGPPGHCPTGLLREGETGLDHAAWAEAGGGKARPEGPPYPLTDQELAVPHGRLFTTARVLLEEHQPCEMRTRLNGLISNELLL